jgi:hypothetical protein
MHYRHSIKIIAPGKSTPAMKKEAKLELISKLVLLPKAAVRACVQKI